jgi:hypothetical protein
VVAPGERYRSEWHGETRGATPILAVSYRRNVGSRQGVGHDARSPMRPCRLPRVQRSYSEETSKPPVDIARETDHLMTGVEHPVFHG